MTMSKRCARDDGPRRAFQKLGKKLTFSFQKASFQKLAFEKLGFTCAQLLKASFQPSFQSQLFKSWVFES